ncbi:hypothetical protein G3A_14320 [Bacillus sp. 17376]|uniref:Uncharacterized protein n=1 Tax=Mesobacillus boroniphilus JCM 21738 TaxID=1294265 RepID=W4RR76_9BACI|nr:hypothetical protein [Mesobacillus boroniphilus]ESU31845.1 hypothetical protein G3A_14320 [Bacillus sp. 17376]GAE46378.1 hypothetical protein JCM21738_3277 [Mesobacillus boroniphilus JCM 21738]
MIENTELLKASESLNKFLNQSSTQTTRDKIESSKAKKNNPEEIINNLEEIINNLIAEKNELISIAQTYDEQLVSQKISDEDIKYITENLLPLLEKMMEYGDPETVEENLRNIETFKPLLSKETFNIMQLLGFNFKKAIGEPLTELVNGLISSKIPSNSHKEKEYQVLVAQREVEYLKIIQDEEAYQRFLDFRKN